MAHETARISIERLDRDAIRANADMARANAELMRESMRIDADEIRRNAEIAMRDMRIRHRFPDADGDATHRADASDACRWPSRRHIAPMAIAATSPTACRPLRGRRVIRPIRYIESRVTR